MDEESRVKSAIPRGFSRFFMLQVIEEEPRTGKEIIDEAIRRSEGAWKPSPGLVYPLLGRLLEKGLVEEEDGRFGITSKGIQTLQQNSEIQEQLQRQLEVFTKIGVSGKFLSESLFDRLLGLTSTVAEKLEKMGKKHNERYKSFLKNELRRVETVEASENSHNAP